MFKTKGVFMKKNTKKILKYVGFSALAVGGCLIAGLTSLHLGGMVMGIIGFAYVGAMLSTDIEDKMNPAKKSKTVKIIEKSVNELTDIATKLYEVEEYKKDEQLSINFDENKQLSIDFENKSSSNSNNKELEK